VTDTDISDAVLPEGWTELDYRAIDTVRVLAADAVQNVGSGHPGTAMSLAPVAYLLFQKIMRHNPSDTHWPGRDRFVLSCGHTSLTLYIQLYLGGFGLELDDIKSYRFWGSKTPGHPEYAHTKGVEVTTGPLGQGVANAVGMAMAARRERGLLDPDAAPGTSVFDHHIYCLASDGDIEEGVSSEASSLAGTQRLSNLTLIYDSNRISIEDDTNIALTEDTPARYAAYGWHVQTVDWTHGDAHHYSENVAALAEALEVAKTVPDRPTFICLKTIIGWPAPKLQGTGKAHGSALGEEEVAATKKVLGFDPDKTFVVADEVINHTRKLIERGAQAQQEWQQAYDSWAEANPERKALYERLIKDDLSPGWEDVLPSWDADPKGIATRAASGKVISAIAPKLPELWGGSADLAESNNTTPEGEPSFLPTDRQSRMFRGGPYGRVLHFGIREHAMGAIMNGIKVHGGLRPYGWHVLDLQRLYAPGGTACGTHEAAGDLRVDPRFDRPGRGRTHPSADRASRRATGDSRTGRSTAGGRQRDRGCLGSDLEEQRQTRRAGPHPAGGAHFPTRRGRLCRHLRGGQGRLHTQGQ
jgi:transketolase